MNVTKGIFRAIMMAKEALDEDPQDQMRVGFAMLHLEFMAGGARAAEYQPQRPALYASTKVRTISK